MAQAWVESGELPDAARAELTPVLTRLADGGNPLAQYYLYRMMTLGDRTLTEAEREEAGRRLQPAAEQGCPRAQADLSAEYFQRKFFEGRPGYKKSTFRARTWAEYAAGQKYHKGNRLLAMVHLFGDGGERNPGLARSYAMKAYGQDRDDTAWHRWFRAELRKAMFGE